MSTRAILAIAVAALCYFVMSSLVSQMGVASTPMAQHFGMGITEVVPLFSFLTGGSFAGIFVSLFIFNYLSVRQVLLLFSGLLVVAATANYLLDSIVFVPIGFAIMGISGGVGIAAAAITISSSFEEEHRASMLVGADLFYSAGGYLIVTLVALMVTAGVVWSVGYLVVGGVSVLIFCISLMAKFPDTHSESSGTDVESQGTFWSINAYLTGAAMFFYVMGQNAFVVWAPTYLSEVFSVGLEEAGSAVSNYWGAGLVGLVISALVLQKVTTNTFLVVISASGMLLTAVFMFADSLSVFIIASALLGLVTIGSFGSMISLGVQQQDNPPINLVPFLLCCGSSGATISHVLSSYLVDIWGIGISVKIIFSAYLAVFLIVSFVSLVRNKRSDVRLVCKQESI